MDQKTVARVAHLARLEISQEQQETLVGQLSSIIGFVEQLSEVNTDNVKPLASVVDAALPLRKDEVTDGQKKEAILANSPEQNEDFFVVTKIVE
ncbi:MAG: Asp-tRNA(Asn)/Glu-tRNA(Gln) amidotransferase subunit GatC [Alphaproteobacteria bacterium]|nr:Asp-tRNA(Asn)/Glu-tRNA(Gln) amidotransferase subunit GatC [Alphaproteobacteria bacterium]